MTIPGTFRPARVGEACLVAIVAGVVGWIFMDWWNESGGGYFPLPWTAVAGTAALAVAVLAAGWPVRRWVRGRRDRALDPLVAARTVVFAKAAAYGGAAVAGWYAAQAITLIGEDSTALHRRLLLALLATLSAAALSAAGFVVQRWCRVPRDKDDERTATS